MRVVKSPLKDWVPCLRPIHNTPEEFEKGFTVKKHQMFSAQTTLVEFKTTTIIGHFGFVGNSIREITRLS